MKSRNGIPVFSQERKEQFNKPNNFLNYQLSDTFIFENRKIERKLSVKYNNGCNIDN